MLIIFFFQILRLKSARFRAALRALILYINVLRDFKGPATCTPYSRASEGTSSDNRFHVVVGFSVLPDRNLMVAP